MTKRKLFEDIKRDPARIYRSPADVLRDRRFGDAERLEILTAWGTARGDDEIGALIAELKARLNIQNRDAQGHAAE